MKAITYTAARQNLAKTMKNVCNDHAPVIVTRKTTDSKALENLNHSNMPCQGTGPEELMMSIE